MHFLRCMAYVLSMVVSWATIALCLPGIVAGCSHTTAYYPSGATAIDDWSLFKDRLVGGGAVTRDGVNLKHTESTVSVEAVKELGRIARP